MLAGVAMAASLIAPANPAVEKFEENRLAAIQTLLDVRARALSVKDKAAFLATVDPAAAPEFRSAQTALFDSLMPLSLGTWRYEVFGGEWLTKPRRIDRRKHHGEVWLPYVRLLYRLHDFDTDPVVRALDYTFVRRGTRWYLASDTDLDEPGRPRPRRDPWDFGPVNIRRTKHALVIAHDTKSADMVAEAADAAVRNVTTIWGDDWPQAAVVVVARDESEYRSLTSRVTDETVAHIEATALPVYNYVPGVEQPPTDAAQVGFRVVIAPSAVARGSVDGRLLSHEFLHIATDESNYAGLPGWLFEGLPEWAARYELPPFPRAARLALRVERSGPPTELPHTFHTDPADRGDDYVLSELLCRWIVERYGLPRLVQLYRAVGQEVRDVTDESLARRRVDEVMRRVLGVSESKVLHEWQRYLRYHLRSFDGLFATFPGYSPVQGEDGVTRAAGGTERDNVFVPMESRRYRGPGGRTIVVSIFDMGTPAAAAERNASGLRTLPSVPGVTESWVSAGEIETFFGTFHGRTVGMQVGRLWAQTTFAGPVLPSEIPRLARLQHAQLKAALARPQP